MSVTDLTPNIPEVVAEVRELFERYEQALIDKNVEVLDATFWNSPHTIRLANNEHGYGFDRIHAFRVARPPGPGTKERRLRLDIVTLGRAARNDGNVKTRQPLALMYIQGEPMNEHYVKIVTEELNVKKAEFVNDASGFLSYQVKPQLKTLGPRYGKILPKIGAHLSQSGVGNAVVRAHASGKNYEVTIEEVYTIVVLDTKLTQELIDEGFVRELISKVQTMRKEAGFEVSDHIALSYDGSAKIEEIFSRFGDEILSETLGVALTRGAKGYTKEWDVNKESVTLGVEKK